MDKFTSLASKKNVFGSDLNTCKKTGYYCQFCGKEIHNF